MTPAVILAVVVLVAPGAGLGAAVGLRGAAIVIAAAPLTLSLVGVLAIILSVVEVQWTPLAFGVGVLAVMLPAWLIWLLAGRPRMRIARLSVPSLLIGMAVLTGFTLTTMIALFPRPDLVAQTFDNVFHLNVIRYAMDTGRASSFTVAGLTSGGQPPTFYPAGWHAFIALVVETVGLVEPKFSIPLGVSAGTIAVILFAWSLGCLAVGQVVAGPSLISTTITAAAVGSTYLFPWLFIRWGSLYPNLLGNALIPPLLALLILLTRPAARDQQPRRAIPTPAPSGAGGQRSRAAARSDPELAGRHPVAVVVVTLLAAVPGVALAHPNSAFALGLAGIATAWLIWGQRLLPLRLRAVPLKVIALGALIAVSYGFVQAWVQLAPAQPQAPAAPSDWATAVNDLLLGASNERVPAAPALTVLMGLGIIGLAARRMILPALWSLLAATIYLIAVGGPTAELAFAAGGLFYSDTLRIMAFVLVLSVPLLAAGAGAVADAIGWLSGRVRLGSALGAVLTVVVAGAIAVPMQLYSLQPAIAQASGKYVVPSPQAQYLSQDELDLISKLDAFVPSGSRVVADPGNGGGFIYALSGVKLVFPHMFVTDSAASAQLRQSMFDADELDATCKAIADLNAYYFYDTERWHSRLFSGPDYFPGLAKPKMAMLEPVAQIGEAALYRFTACDS